MLSVWSMPWGDLLTVFYTCWLSHTSKPHPLPQAIFASLTLLFPTPHRAEVNLRVEEFNTIGDRVPLLANLKPHGRLVRSSCLQATP